MDIKNFIFLMEMDLFVRVPAELAHFQKFSMMEPQNARLVQEIARNVWKNRQIV